MQDKRIAHHYEENSRALSPLELRQLAKSEEPLQTICDLSSKENTQLITMLPVKFRKFAIQSIVEQYMTAMKLHALQLAALFYRRAEEEEIDAEDRDEILQDMEEGVAKIVALSQQVQAYSIEDFFKLGTIVASAIGLTQAETAEEAVNSLDDFFVICQGRLEQAYLLEKNE